MNILNEYLMNDYVKEKEQLKSVNEIIKKVIPIYGRFDDKIGWEYTFTSCRGNNKGDRKRESKEIKKSRDRISTSTLSMIAFSMKVLKEGIPDLNNNETCSDIALHYETLPNEEREEFKSIYEKSKKLLCEIFKKEKNKFVSNTYGINDPFTRVWVQSIIEEENLLDLLELLEQDKYVERIFDTIYADKNNLNYTDDKEKKIEPTHVFPLLKVIQLYNILKEKINYGNIISIKNEVMNVLFEHLSLAEIENSNFDTAELVFALEGVLLLDENKENFDRNLVKQVFEVIKKRQTISMYWRPLKPFVMNERGLALLPLSVEIAMSLIRICRLLGKFGETLFTEYFDVFNLYTDWIKIKMNIISCDCKGNKQNGCYEGNNYPNLRSCKNLYGWCSEHVHQSDVIHLWQTSQILIYLANFNNMLQKHIASKTFRYAGLFYKDCGHNENAWNKWMEGEPLNKEGFAAYEDINKKYIRKDRTDKELYKSMLLYGPPGTGKTTIAEKIAETKGWPLVTITPSDFIASGADLVEAKAKNIFKVLEEQENMVVLFDEIDRLILDRDSKEYTKQSDIFQFMTPSMLVKIKELRNKGKIIFIIATNYEERIDMAIKRTGRIDEKYLILPPGKETREKIFDEDFSEPSRKDSNNKFNNEKEKAIKEKKEEIIKKTALFTYTEFKQLMKLLQEYIKSCLDNNIKMDQKKMLDLIEEPSISIKSCSKKISNKSWNQKPYKEFFALIYLKAECGDFTNKEKESIKEVLEALKKASGREPDKVLTDEEEFEETISRYVKNKNMIDIIFNKYRTENCEG